jgi:hypothetical protein
MPFWKLRRRNRRLALLAPSLDIHRTLQLTRPTYAAVWDDADLVVAVGLGAGEGLSVVWGRREVS